MDNELEVHEGREELAARSGGDGMPLGNEPTPLIAEHQVVVPDDGGASEAIFDDDAAATICYQDFRDAQQWLDTNSWLAEWQYIDYLYQSPNYDRDWRQQTNRPARVPRFNVAKNRNTMSNQVRRSIFNGDDPFVLKPTGKLAQMGDKAQTYVEAWTHMFRTLLKRADFEYQFSLFIECQCLQGSAIANPGWEERSVIRRTRKRKAPPAEVPMPVSGTKKVNTWESDEYIVREDEVTECWPFFEYRRLGTTLFDKKWRTPNRPDLSANYKIDVDYVTFQDLQQMRELDCYKDIPDDEELKKFFMVTRPQGDAETASQVAQSMNTQSTVVLHADGEHTDSSEDPLLTPVMKIARWTKERVVEVIRYQGRMKVIRNGEHELGDHALGYTANWWNIDNSGYGIGIGRLNASDQRMDQGVLGEILKMIAFPMNAPILYDSSSGNAPTENVVTAFGTFWGIQNPPQGDVSKALKFFEIPRVPPEAFDIYKLGKEGGEDLVGANSTTMQGNLGGKGSSAMRTATGVDRIGGKADENISDPVFHLEGVIQRFLQFLWEMVLEHMPPREIREILSQKFSDAIIEQIDPEEFFNVEFEIQILCGQKLQTRANIMQLVPFMLQLVQQPQLLQFNHEKGMTIDFGVIERIFLQMSEMSSWEEAIFIPLTPDQKQMVQQMNPNAMKAQVAALIEQLRGKNKIDEINAKGKQEQQNIVLDKALEHVSGDVPLDLAEARVSRNTDMQELQGGFGEAAGS